LLVALLFAFSIVLFAAVCLYQNSKRSRVMTHQLW